MSTVTTERVRAVVALAVTLAVIHFVPSRPLVVILLITAWWGLFHPIERIELILAGVAAAFFLVQNYVALDAGLFEFKFKDVLLQPLYEPFLWGFYFLSMKRFVSGRASDHPALSGKAIAGLVATSLMFSIAGADSRVLLLATGCSTLLLLAMFHTAGDLAYAACALVLGLASRSSASPRGSGGIRRPTSWVFRSGSRRCGSAWDCSAGGF